MAVCSSFSFVCGRNLIGGAGRSAQAARSGSPTTKLGVTHANLEHTKELDTLE